MKALTPELTASFRKSFEEDRAAKTANAAMAKTEMADLAYIPMNAAKLQGEFEIELKTRGITAQQKSGRCWMFAAMNIIREIVAEKLNLKEFELSENYLAFYDKLEKANNYLEMMIANADKPVDDRTVEWLLSAGIGDGGYWDMAVDLVKKYGVVPKYVMPESYQSEHTAKFMDILNCLLHKDAEELRGIVRAGGDPEPRKEQMMAEIYKAECIVFGEPVESFDFEYRDADNQYHADRNLTPKAFYDKYVGINLDDYVTVTNMPSRAYNERYTFHYTGSMAESGIYQLNLTMDEVQELVLAQLKGGEPVWFGCDAGAFGARKEGVWDPDSFDYQGLLGGVDFTLDKKNRLAYRSSSATHAMILIGVSFGGDGQPARWKIENSWGKENGKDGYYVCSQKYFREYVYETIINKKYLTDAQKALLEKKPIEVPLWNADSMA